MSSEKWSEKIQYKPRLTPKLESNDDQTGSIKLDQEIYNTSNPLKLNGAVKKSKLINELFKIEEQYDKFEIKFQFPK